MSSSRGTSLSCVVLTAICIAVFGPCDAWSAQDEANVTVLLSTDSLTREIEGGERHCYEVSLRAGRYVCCTVSQHGIDIEAALYSPTGDLLVRSNVNEGMHGLEAVRWVSAVDGSYTFTVASPWKAGVIGQYELSMRRIERPSEEDRERVRAGLLLDEAMRLRLHGTGESTKQAGEKLQALSPRWHALGESYWEAATLQAAGLTCQDLGELPKALELLDRALALWRQIGDPDQEGDVLSIIGVTHLYMTEPRKALEPLERSLKIRMSAGEAQSEADALHNLGSAHAQLGEFRKAVECLDLARQLWRKVADLKDEAITLNMLAVCHYYSGNLQAALDSFLDAGSIARDLGDRRNEASALFSTAKTYRALGEEELAITYFREALPRLRDTGDRRAEAVCLNYLGTEHRILGDLERAHAYFTEALELRRTIGDHGGEAETLANLGDLYSSTDRRKEALDAYERSLARCREGGYKLGEARALLLLGLEHATSGESPAALEYLDQALRLQREVGPRRDEATTLYHLARVKRDTGDIDEALRDASDAIAIHESMRSKVMNYDLRASYLASVNDIFDLYVAMLMDLHAREPSKGYDAQAIEASERARGRILLDLLSESRMDIREGVDPALLESERELRDLLSAKLDRQVKILGGQHTEEQSQQIGQEIGDLTVELRQVEARLRATSPRYAALIEPRPLRLGEIQERLLDAKTLLLEYDLGTERSFLWAVSSSGLKSYVLPKCAEIEAAARRVYELLADPNAGIQEEPYWKAADALSRMILAPLSEHPGKSRLLIVSEGTLQYVPFGALPAVAGRRRPLVVDYEICGLPSASVLGELRKERDAIGEQPEKAIVVFADPVFDREDERVRGEGKRGEPESAPVSRTLSGIARDYGMTGDQQGFSRLPFTRREAMAILDLAPPSAGEAALDFDAARARVLDPSIGDFRFVHFATHGFLDSMHPELSGIVLSLVDAQGNPQNGFLSAGDMYNLKLAADLVVLSACRTALGKDVRGEGLVGLTRGLMYAGAARVVASLWKVDDAATAELMKRFYARMLGKEDPMKPAAALRAAQTEMWNTKRWRAPYYWAAFVLQGEW